jgi:hypothetical protein
MLNAVLLIGFVSTTCRPNCTSVNSRNGVVSTVGPSNPTTLTVGPSAHQNVCVSKVLVLVRGSS